MDKASLLKLVLILISFGIILWYYGFFSPYNYFQAKTDIRNNTPKKILVGEQLVYPKDLNKISKKYGFENIAFGCTITLPELNGIKSYNKVIDEHLNDINEANWMEIYQKQIDSIKWIKIENKEIKLCD
ncbi:hypothetical protein EYD45_05020 [Hyunsoonleella flava]|uniref:Uncharacterized protein n=1 Tax=Hyunsoonleella flava TaxID=2527939 RepID=A0A4Q9FL62_9FLAO|nr:hypothetical protein [Hyunsoonleella flava]TBN05638.1 hypothetical protein EYD45_05020 [Hyunsoonleella flava]